MALIDDINEMKRVYSESSLLGKVLIFLSGLLAISSVASISEDFVKWKGFILDGISAYKTYLVNPAIELGNIVGLEYTSTEIHAAVIGSISVSLGMKILVAGQRVAFEQINKKYGSNVSPNVVVYHAVAIIFPIAILVWYGVNKEPPSMVRAWLVFLFYPVFLFVPKYVLSILIPNRFSYYEKGHFSYAKSYYSLVAALFLIVGVLGAINAAVYK